MKYFFLAEGWTVGRVWEFGGLWNETAWRRKPEIKRLNICFVEQNEKLWLYQVEEEIIMLEVNPTEQNSSATNTIGQVVLKRLISAEQVIELLATAEAFNSRFVNE
ncbi:MAG TPA: hypothetical protein V6D15_22880 [Oculatellaceae cyanobacterium]